ncbi:hypothetical protein BT69DRAFT_1281268 [Atractiella rhizophila]|nr:hypothetical protein BT69DRAFT_1281268 [Atractiella rhizophila]
MDLLNKLAGNDSHSESQSHSQPPAEGGAGALFNQLQDKFLGEGNDEKEAKKKAQKAGLFDKLNTMAGGGAKSEANEDALDKAIDFVQEKFLKGGDQSNESAVEQLKDEEISDMIRSKYKEMTGQDFPVKDKKH